MNMQKVFTLSLITLPVLLVLDFIWIGFIANNFYKTEYGPLYSPHPVWIAAALFYIFYAAGLAFFSIAPAIQRKSLSYAVGTGAFLALVAFGTYDLTSLAITTNWPVLLSVVDMSWGVFGGAVTSGVVYLLATKFFKF